jgi:hypothetical protein
MTLPRTATSVGAEIIQAREDFLAADLQDDSPARDKAETLMNLLLEEYGHIPHTRLPSDMDGHTSPRPAR